jgi:pimeloyl-ACP methyl ester carboxylesterase
VALDLAEQLVPADQVAPLTAGILTFLHASHLALFDQDKAAGGFAAARAREQSMAEPGRTILHLVNQRDVRALGPLLLPHISNLGDDSALSPDRSPAPEAPVFLLHGAEDNVVPAIETLRLARHLESRTRVHMLLTPLISHAEVDRPATTGEIVSLVKFWAGMF